MLPLYTISSEVVADIEAPHPTDDPPRTAVIHVIEEEVPAPARGHKSVGRRQCVFHCVCERLEIPAHRPGEYMVQVVEQAALGARVVLEVVGEADRWPAREREVDRAARIVRQQ